MLDQRKENPHAVSEARSDSDRTRIGAQRMGARGRGSAAGSGTPRGQKGYSAGPPSVQPGTSLPCATRRRARSR